MEEKQPKEVHQFTRGMYRGVRISVKSLNFIIVAGLAAIVILMIYGIATGGYHLTFDSNGGSDIPYQEYEYGEVVRLPEEPTREGYVFDGWYLDENCTNPLEADHMMEQDTTVYAKWIEKEESQ